MRLIDKDELLEELRDKEGEALASNGNELEGLRLAIDIVVDAIPDDAEPVRHGTWVWYSSTMMECSACGRTVPRHRYKGCPHCRAKMSPLLGVKMDGGGE